MTAAHSDNVARGDNHGPPWVVTALIEMPAGSLLDERALAEALGVSTRTVRRMVGRFELPPGVKLGGRKVWLADKVVAFVRNRAERLAEKAEKEAARIQEFL